MTVYTTIAIATNAIGNIVTVASANNMVSGMPITFSGNVFGNIIPGATYYIGNISYGYPTSNITLTSLPGIGGYPVTSNSGSMTGTFSSGGQQIIPTEAPGVPLNTAFTYINTNFDQIFAAGPVGSNVQIRNNTIYTLDTNGNLTLNPNGIGNIMANASINPAQDRVWSLGAPTLRWESIYVEYGEIANANISSITLPVANFHLLGGNNNNILSTDGAGNLSWIPQTAYAGGNNTQIQYNNNGVLDGSNTFTFNSNTSTVTMANLTTVGKANLNNVSNVFIAGGTAGYVLQTDGTGNLSWVTPTGNTSVILDQQIQGDGSNVSYNLITSGVTNSVLVAINGVQQLPGTAYTVAANVITFAEPLQTSEIADIRFLVGGPAGNGQPGGANGSIQFNNGAGLGGAANLTYNQITGNLYSSNLVVGGNVTASYYYGNGSLLTGVTATANTGTITFANNVISTSDSGNAVNIVGPQSTPVSMATGGNSATAQLLWATNIGALTTAQLNNGIINGNTWGSQISAGNIGVVIASNSAAGLKTWTFKTDGTLSSTGSISVGNVNVGNISATGTITANVDVSAVGNVSGSYILGNVALANGLPEIYGNSNVANYLNGYIGDVIPLANISYSLGNATNQWADLWVSNGTIYMNSVPITLGAGNVLSVAGNSVVTTTGGSTSLGNIGFVGNTIYDINGINLENSDLTHGYTAGVFIPSNGSANAILLNNTYGNVILQSGANSDPTAAWTFSNNGNVTLPGGGLLGDTYGDNANSAGLQAGPGGYAGINSYDQGQFVQADGNGVYIGTDYTGNSCLWTFNASGNLILPGNASSINYANGQPYGGTGTTTSPGGNTTELQFNNANSFAGSTNLTFDSANAKLRIGGAVSATGNITGNYFIGNGSQLTGITVSANTGNVTFDNSTVVGPSFGVAPSANSSVYIQPTVDSATVYQFSGSTLSAPGNISAVGNVAGGNLIATGTVSASGNVTGNYILGNGSGLTNVATQVTGSWTVPVGNSTQSFTVTPNETYYMWVDCNIPNGILAWNATATVTNTNVPVVGVQYAWVYNGGGSPIDFTSIPNQFVGTANTIVRSSVAPSATTNRFDFGINNTSGNSQTVRYGWTQIS